MKSIDTFIGFLKSDRRDPPPSPSKTFDIISNEILLEIFLHLPLKDLPKLSLVNKRWRRVSLDHSIYNSCFQECPLKETDNTNWHPDFLAKIFFVIRECKQTSPCKELIDHIASKKESKKDGDLNLNRDPQKI